jgi:hypothetical protein
VVDFVAVKAPKSHKDQQQLEGAGKQFNQEALILIEFQQTSTNHNLAFFSLQNLLIFSFSVNTLKESTPPKDNFSSEALVDLCKQDKDGDQ